MEWLTTSTILEQLATESDTPVWQRFVARFRAPIVRIARRGGMDADDAEDVAQETLKAFIEAFRAGRYERDRGQLRRWLFGIAYRQMLRQRERRARVEVPLEADEAALGREWDVEWESSLLDQCLEQARRETSADVWAAFDLVALRSRTPADAAQVLSMPVKFVYNAKHRVLERLRQLLAEAETP